MLYFTNMNEKIISKYLSYILRHHPQSIKLKLDAQGWADISTLLKNSSSDLKLNRKQLEYIVNTNDKKRFQISEDGLKIRAVQGHSTSQVDISFKAKVPPAMLYHGTADRFISSILEQGLLPQSRQYVHLSEHYDTAYTVGKRYGKPHIFKVDAQRMYQEGFEFLQAKNGVWLIKHVPQIFLN